MTPRHWMVLGALLGALGVPLGAYGAHGLENRLADAQLTAATAPELIGRFEVAVRYQMFHAPVLLVIGLMLVGRASRCLAAAAWAMLLGVMLFSGFLFASVFTLGQIPWFVHVVPFGGGLMIVGWVLLAFGVWKVFAPAGEAADSP